MEVSEIGEKISFVPYAFVQYKQGDAMQAVRRVTGTVVQIHRAHRWFRVEYRLPGVAWPCHECFKF